MHYDICFALDPWSGVVALVLKKLRKVKMLVYEDADHCSSYMFIRIGSRLAYYITDFIERNVVRRADIIISISKTLARLRRRQGAKHVYATINGFGKHLYGVTPDLSSNTIIYAGMLAEWTGVKELILGVKKALEKNPNIRLLIVGEGSLQPLLERMVKENNISENVIFLGRIPYENMHMVLSRASIGAAVFTPSETMRYAIMLKLMDYLGAGLPVIVTDFGENARIVKHAKAGICVKCNPDSIAHGILNLLNDKNKLHYYSQNAKNFSRGKDWDSLLNRELGIIMDYYIKYFKKHVV